jgi:trehalose 6-phosphate phosphatase
MPPVVDRPLFFLDYDGTLAPIVDDPDEAVPHPDVPDLLRTLDARYPVWIVTGRDLRALSRFLDRPYNAIGLHGAQQGIVGGEVERLMSDDAARALEQLRASVPAVEGLRVEEKDQSFAVHYRDVEREADARERLRSWVETMPDILDAIWGKKVVELRPEGLTKGTAVRRVAAEHPARTPVYLGDDTTDEDAFAALQALDRKAVTVRIGEADTGAEYRLADPDDVVAYLKRYVQS